MEIKTSIVKNEQVGYSFSVNIEKETRAVTEAKYPDKEVVSVRLAGNEESWIKVVERLKEAKLKVKEVLEK